MPTPWRGREMKSFRSVKLSGPCNRNLGALWGHFGGRLKKSGERSALLSSAETPSTAGPTWEFHSDSRAGTCLTLCQPGESLQVPASPHKHEQMQGVSHSHDMHKASETGQPKHQLETESFLTQIQDTQLLFSLTPSSISLDLSQISNFHNFP